MQLRQSGSLLLNGSLFVLDPSVDLPLGICVCTYKDGSWYFLLAIDNDATKHIDDFNEMKSAFGIKQIVILED